MKIASFMFFLLTSVASYSLASDVSDVDVSYMGYGKSSIDSDVEYVLLSLNLLNGGQCKLLLPQLVPFINSKRNDNPFVSATCTLDGVEFIQSDKASTSLSYKLNYYGGSSSSFNLAMTLVDVHTNKVLSVNVEDFVLKSEKNKAFIGLEK